MSCTKQWIINKSDSKKSIVDRLLEIRGITTEDAKREFLHPLEITLTHPNAFCDMKKAVDRVVQAIDNKEKILIYGDFDADGVTSTSLLLKTFRFLGGEVEYYIPNRETEGHGLDSKSLIPYLKPNEAKLVITVDNGISSVKEVNLLNVHGKDVIITDHHEAPEELPNAYAIINPKAMGSLDEKLTATQIEYLTSLAGVGVAFKLAQGVLERYNKLDYSYEILPYVTVGTIADLVPLIGENRYFVTRGLELISQGKHYGLKKMLEAAGINTENGLTSEQIAFTVAPRINASGRLDTVDAAIKLMTSENKTEIEMAILTLDNFNKARQELCNIAFEEADEMWKSTGMKDNAIVLFNKDWRVGIVGIVASKFVEKYYKPAFIMTYSEQEKQFRCSARGVNELNIYEIIQNLSEYAEGGGHKLAGGFSFDEEKASFETIKKLINKTVDEMLGEQKLNPSLIIDLELDVKDIDTSLIEEINRLEPFGMSNPSPTFVLKNLTLKEKKLMGSNKEHLKLKIDTPNGIKDCVWWSKGDLPLISGDKLDIAFAPQLNTFNGVTDIQLIIKDIHADALKEEENFSAVKIYDHRKKTNIFAQVNDYIKNAKLGISVFAEDRNILEMLKPYENIKNCVINRQNADKNDVLMFFDYPCDEEVYEQLKQKVSPKALHYMNYQNFKPDEEGILKAFASMIRYSCNNLNGQFILVRAASALGITEEIVELLLEMFEECGMIKIISREENSYNITLLKSIELSELKNSQKYKDFVELITEINEYKNNFMKIEL